MFVYVVEGSAKIGDEWLKVFDWYIDEYNYIKIFKLTCFRLGDISNYYIGAYGKRFAIHHSPLDPTSRM